MTTIRDFLATPVEAYVWIPLVFALLCGLFLQVPVLGRMLTVVLLAVLMLNARLWQHLNNEPGWLSSAFIDKFGGILLMTVVVTIVTQMFVKTIKVYKANQTANKRAAPH